MTDPAFRTNNPQMDDHFAAVYEATAPHARPGPKAGSTAAGALETLPPVSQSAT